MTIRLSAELEAFVNDQVRSGRFASADAAVADAVRRMKERDEKIAWLRREIQLGEDDIARGDYDEWDVEEMKARLRAKYPSAK